MNLKSAWVFVVLFVVGVNFTRAQGGENDQPATQVVVKKLLEISGDLPDTAAAVEKVQIAEKQVKPLCENNPGALSQLLKKTAPENENQAALFFAVLRNGLLEKEQQARERILKYFWAYFPREEGVEMMLGSLEQDQKKLKSIRKKAREMMPMILSRRLTGFRKSPNSYRLERIIRTVAIIAQSEKDLEQKIDFIRRRTSAILHRRGSDQLRKSLTRALERVRDSASPLEKITAVSLSGANALSRAERADFTDTFVDGLEDEFGSEISFIKLVADRYSDAGDNRKAYTWRYELALKDKTYLDNPRVVVALIEQLGMYRLFDKQEKVLNEALKRKVLSTKDIQRIHDRARMTQEMKEKLFEQIFSDQKDEGKKTVFDLLDVREDAFRNFSFLLQAARRSIRKGKEGRKTAIRYVFRVLMADPDNKVAFNQLVSILKYDKGEKKELIEAEKQRLDLAARQILKDIEKTAGQLTEKGEVEKAVALIQKGLRLDPENPSLKKLLSKLLKKMAEAGDG